MRTDRHGAARGHRERSQRQLRVGEMLRHVLAGVLERGEIRDPDFADASVTVTEVRVSPDLRNAVVFVMPLGGERSDEVVGALTRAAPYLRRQVARSATLKYLPALAFEVDTSFDQASRIDSLLRSTSPRPDGEWGGDDGA